MTEIFGVIGYPVKHSMSPAMHNAAFRKTGYDGVYIPLEVKPENFQVAIDGIKAIGFRGINVTIPYKERITELFRNGKEVMEIGAANTVDLRKGICHNTDVDGVTGALQESGVGTDGMKVLVVGAGGAARACVYALRDSNDVFITNRTAERGMDIAERFGVEFIREKRVETMEFDLIVNATPLGMRGFPEKLPVPEKVLQKRPAVFDMVYNPPETVLIRKAASYGCRIVSGVDMLVYQGAKAFEIFTGNNAPVQVMKRAVISELKKIS